MYWVDRCIDESGYRDDGRTLDSNFEGPVPDSERELLVTVQSYDLEVSPPEGTLDIFMIVTERESSSLSA